VGYIIAIAQVARDLWVLVNKPCLRAMPSDSSLTAINLWYCAIIMTKLLGTLGSKVEE